MNFILLKEELKVLASAQQEFIDKGWKRVKAVQRKEKSSSAAYGIVYEKNGRQYYLNLNSASKASQFINQ